MSIRVPNLDDRRFQDLVDDAKRRIADRCPEWTDHNVSDPGITLLELFAHMTEELMYRVNRVPENLLLLLMNTIGLRPEAPRSARTPLTFWLASPTRYWAATTEDTPLLASPGVEVSTERTADGDRITFRTSAELRAHRAQVVGRYVTATTPEFPWGELTPLPGSDVADVLGAGTPVAGAAFLVELARSLPGCAIKLELDCVPNRGTGIVPDDPPLVWEAWGRGTWLPCDVDRDTTGGLNRPGAVYLHVPPDHTEATVAGTTPSAWLRCRLVRPRPGQPSYEQSPAIGRIVAETLGVTVPAVQSDQLVRDEVLGVSDGRYGQPPFHVRNVPVVDDDGGPLLFAGADPEPWVPVTSFAASEEHDRHYLLDRVSGEVRLGVAVRQADGRVRRYAAVPPASAPLRLAEYRVGGGVRGNVRATALRVLRAPVAHVRAVENRHAATGGVDPETVEQVTERIPLFLRQRTRAVTIADFAHMARDASGSVARSHAVPEGDPEVSMAVRVLVVPELPPRAGLDAPLPLSDLTDVPETMTAVARYLDERRLLGVRVLVSPPRYVPCRTTVRLAAAPTADPARVEQTATEALYLLLHPLHGGEDGRGWPFGTDVQAGDLYAALQRVPGVVRVESVVLRDAEDQETARLGVPLNGLPLSLGHTVVLT